MQLQEQHLNHRAQFGLAGQSTFKSRIIYERRNAAEKYCWELLLKNTVDKYFWQILLTNIFDKYCWQNCWQIQLRNTVDNYSSEIQLRNTIEKYCWEILLKNTVQKYSWEIQLKNTVEKYCWGWQGEAHLNHEYERINVAAAAPCILFFMEMQWFGRATFFHENAAISIFNIPILPQDDKDHIIPPILGR